MLEKIRCKRFIPYFTLTAVVLVSTMVLWLPFLLRFSHWFGLTIPDSNFLYIYKHYDGPLYIIPAKSFYDPTIIKTLRVDVSLAPTYYAAHLPLYPVFIRLFSYVFGYLKSMVLVNLVFTVILAGFFYYFLKYFRVTNRPVWLTAVFLMLPRFLIVRSVGAPESLFLLTVLLSLFFFERKQYWLAGGFGALATMTKSPGVLLFGAYLLVFIEALVKNRQEKILTVNRLGILLIPVGLLAVFGLYYFRYGDFLAYFHSGNNIHLAYPFAVFNAGQPWVGTAWLEDVVFIFFAYILALFSLSQTSHRSWFYFFLIYFIATTFVQHRDISRYSLPLWPLACVAFSRFIGSKKFVLAALIILPAIYFYGWNFLTFNIMPIGEWQPFI
ncbi:hypothetical protein M1523_02245 [Patescibacteria group bacterium]|nr:hypothetical protein [Patescibacteria group bacterium]MCL5091459.1 hypothetical protein [Patescibacteria group bacterium]